MAFIGQVVPSGSTVDLIVLYRDSARPTDLGIRMPWMFLGVLLNGAAGMLVLAVVFAMLGEWIVAAGLLVGLCLCLFGARATERGLYAGRGDVDGCDAQAVPDASLVR